MLQELALESDTPPRPPQDEILDWDHSPVKWQEDPTAGGKWVGLTLASCSLMVIKMLICVDRGQAEGGALAYAFFVVLERCKGSNNYKELGSFC